MTETIDVDACIRFLNDLARLDSEALASLCVLRVPCNKALANHPTVQVGRDRGCDAMPYTVGIVGILNGLFGVDADGVGFIAAIFDDGELVGFERRGSQ